jgi:hypothetical protein
MNERKPRATYHNFGLEVRLGGELVATARSVNMAKRITFALNQTRDLYNEKEKSTATNPSLQGQKMKTVTINDFLTDAEINQAIRLYQTAQPGTFNKLLSEQIIVPNLERINQALGQENDPHYLAYMVEYVLMQQRS